MLREFFKPHQHFSNTQMTKRKWYDGTLTVRSTRITFQRLPIFKTGLMVRSESRQISCFRTNSIFGLTEHLLILDERYIRSQGKPHFLRYFQFGSHKIGKNPSLFNYEQLCLAAHVIIDLSRASFRVQAIFALSIAAYFQQLLMTQHALQDLSQLSVFLTLKLEI